MKRITLAEVGVSELLPPDLRKELMDVENRPLAERVKRIDKLTDEAARRGLVRERGDLSMDVHWRAQRPERGAK